MPIVTSPGTRPASPGTLPRRPMGALTRTSTALSARNLLVLTGFREPTEMPRVRPGMSGGQNEYMGNPGEERPLHRAPGSCVCKGSGRKQSCHPSACTQGVGPFPVSTVYSVPRVELASNEHSVTIGTSLSKHWSFYQNTGYFSVMTPTPHPSPHRTALTCHLPLAT